MLLWFLRSFKVLIGIKQWKTSIVTKAILNILSNFIPNETVTMKDGDPPWINNKIKSSIKNKAEWFKDFLKPNNPVSIKNFEQIPDALRKTNEISKQTNYSKLSSELETNKINPKC